MNEKLKDYLDKCTPATLDQSILDDLRTAMQEAVPEIAESIRQREELAAQFRLAGWTPSQSDTDKQD